VLFSCHGDVDKYIYMYIHMYIYIKMYTLRYQISLYHYICTQVFRSISLRCMGLYAEWMCGA